MELMDGGPLHEKTVGRWPSTVELVHGESGIPALSDSLDALTLLRQSDGGLRTRNGVGQRDSVDPRLVVDDVVALLKALQPPLRIDEPP